MEGYTDIHSHLLPGVDDGAGDINMSIRMLHMADENGISRIILTPHNKPMHHNVSRKRIKELLRQLQETVAAEGLNIKLFIGNEIYYRSEVMELLEMEKACTMAESSYVLAEFGPMDGFDYIRGGIYRLLADGYRPILAHVERYQSVYTNIGRVEDLVEMGGYIQVNAGSIMGRSGTQTKHFSRKLLKQNLVHFVATDAHDDGNRGVFLTDCAKYIEKKFGGDYMRRLLQENPARVIANEYI